MVEFNNSETLSDWDKWKSTLGKAVNLGESVGISEEMVSKIAYRIGNMLTAAVDPENREERLLQELWKVAGDDERKVLAKLIVKMVQSDVKH